MRWTPKWLVWLLGDDRNFLHPDPMPTLRCATCDRLVTYGEKMTMNVNEWLHADDASPICRPIGLYRT